VRVVSIVIITSIIEPRINGGIEIPSMIFPTWHLIGYVDSLSAEYRECGRKDRH